MAVSASLDVSPWSMTWRYRKIWAQLVIIVGEGCDYGQMAYRYDDEARAGTSQLKIGEDEVAVLRNLCSRKSADFGPRSVHTAGPRPVPRINAFRALVS